MFGGLLFGGAPFAGVVAAVAGLFASPSVAITAAAQFTADALPSYSAVYGGAPFGGVPYGGAVRATSRLAAAVTVTVGVAPPNLAALSHLTADAAIAVATTAQITAPIVLRALPARIEFSVTAAIARLYGGEFWLGGVDVTHRVRKDGVVIHDVLNDAPNTASLTFKGTAVPQVGLPLEIRLSQPPQVLFSGTLQTVERTYESQGNKAALVNWPSTAIDDTAAANRRRPFGSWVDVSASTVAAALATFAPAGFTTRIDAGLPAVTFICDGSETVIAALVRLANLVGGYAKIENKTVYLFITDPDTPPDPVDLAHPPLNDPPIHLTTDVSQLRTRVYGKGYGEQLPGDVNANETLLPIRDGAQFTPTGGLAIAGTTADSAQSQIIRYGGVSRPIGGTLVGPGAAPGTALDLNLAAGTGVTPGRHDVAVAYVTAAGTSLVGPLASIDVGTVTPPATAPAAGTATTGTGPDSGTHDYVLTFEALGGETTPSPVSNAVTTGTATGQLDPPGFGGYPEPLLQPGNLNSIHGYAYQTTFVTAKGETTASGSGPVANGPGNPAYAGPPQLMHDAGGSMTPGKLYQYTYAYVTASGFETLLGNGANITLPAGRTAVTVVMNSSPDARVTKIRIYRQHDNLPAFNAAFLVGEVPNGSSGASYLDKMSDATAVGQPSRVYGVESGTPPGNQMTVSSIPIGPAGVTKRRIYRQVSTGGGFLLVGVLNDNTATTFIDNVAEGSEGAGAPPSNTTGTAVQVIPVTLPKGPSGLTSRKLYRRFNGAGPFRFVAAITNANTVTYHDTTPNSGLGATAPTGNTAAGAQIAVGQIPIGAAAVTARELYMTPAGGGLPLRRALILSNNTATTATITIADATLAAQPAAPAADTSGLTQPTGQVNPGSPTLIVASPAPFFTDGGWVFAGGQVLRYTGISGQLLTGLPASGAGAIVTTILYGQQATPAPTLFGVTGLSKPAQRGAAVHIWVQRDDLAAQAEQAARDGSTGIVEFLLVDERRSEPSLITRCDADLARFSRPIITVQYATRDLKTKSGKTIPIDLASPSIHEVLTIQDVTITEIDTVPGVPPRFSVSASSVRFTLEDTLRRLIAGGQIAGGST
jgi:hypothetical protein